MIDDLVIELHDCLYLKIVLEKEDGGTAPQYLLTHIEDLIERISFYATVDSK